MATVQPQTRSPTASPCPSCGKEMEQGYVIAENYVEGVRWTRHKTRLGTGGDPLAKPDIYGNVYIPGWRCATCRLIILFY